MEIRAVAFDANGTLVRILTEDGMEEIFRAAAHFLTYQGINLCRAGSESDKGEMAINLAEVYKAYGNDDEFKRWGMLAKAWARQGTELYDFIVRQGF